MTSDEASRVADWIESMANGHFRRGLQGQVVYRDWVRFAATLREINGAERSQESLKLLREAEAIIERNLSGRPIGYALIAWWKRILTTMRDA